MSLINFNNRDSVFKKTEKEFPLHPEGNFEGFISKVKLLNHPEHKEGLSICVKTPHGLLFQNIYPETDHKIMKQIAQETLMKIICGAYKKSVPLEDLKTCSDVADAIVELPVSVYVKHKEYKGEKRANTYFNELPDEDKLSELKPRVKVSQKVMDY